MQNCWFHVRHWLASGRSLDSPKRANGIKRVAIDEISNEALGVVRLHADSAHEIGEYAILLRSNLKVRRLTFAHLTYCGNVLSPSSSPA